MQTKICFAVFLAALAQIHGASVEVENPKHGHHKHHKHHKHHGKGHKTSVAETVNTTNLKVNKTAPVHALMHNSSKPLKEAPKAKPTVAAAKPVVSAAAHTSEQETQIVNKMRQLEKKLESKEKAQRTQSMIEKGELDVNGPLPVDFSERFAQAVGQATGCNPHTVKVLSSEPSKEKGVVIILFEAPSDIIKATQDQAADPSSKLANGPLRPFLVAEGSTAESTEPSAAAAMGEDEDYSKPMPVKDSGIDVDTEMPYGELEPFGREDTAQELTEQSVKESDEMVDQLERAEVAEEKRAVFRALTRLRGAAITSFDGVARAQTGNIDEYNKIHKWRRTHPLHHLADEESDISKWAFPSDADF